MKYSFHYWQSVHLRQVPSFLGNMVYKTLQIFLTLLQIKERQALTKKQFLNNRVPFIDNRQALMLHSQMAHTEK